MTIGSIARSVTVSLIVVLAAGSLFRANAQTASLDVNVEREQVAFTLRGKARDLRVEVYSPGGELVFDSRDSGGETVVWNLQDLNGQPVADGVYLATVGLTDDFGTVIKRIEQVIIARHRQGEQQSSMAPAADGNKVDGSGTPGKIAKWTAVTTIGDSVITELNNRIGISIIPTGVLHVDEAQPAASGSNGAAAAPLLQLSGGKGGDTTGVAAIAGAGADVSLFAGNGGSAPAGSTNGKGGNILLQPGSPGAGAGAAGEPGKLLLAPFGGNVGIGTLTPGSTLEVAGDVHSTVGFKFPDGSLQTTAGLAAVIHNGTLAGLGTPGAPLTVAILGISNDQLAAGAVTGAKISVPLALSGSNASPILSVTNLGSGAAIHAFGAINSATGYNIGGSRVMSVGSAGNLFVGPDAGSSNTTGSFNSFFGHSAGYSNTTEDNNTFIGSSSTGATGITNATAIGHGAQVTQSNSLVLGSINSVNSGFADTNVGIGTTAPAARLHVSGTGIIRARVNSDSNAGLALTLGNQPKWSVATAAGGQFLIFNDAIGQNAFSIAVATNFVGINALAAGSTPLCRNASNQIANCSSSLRYKMNIATLHTGLRLIDRLHPVTFDWKQGGEHDLGLVAEEVAKVEPLLVTRNDRGEIEGVKYDRVGVVLINAVKEQQLQIESQQRQIDEQKELIKKQQAAIAALKILVCTQNPTAAICKPKL